MAQDPDNGPNEATAPQPAEPFWRRPLASLTIAEWESLCDGCGRCCLVKLEDEDTGKVHFTDVACTLLDTGTCRCSDYLNRQTKVSDCVKLTADIVEDIAWLPPTCAYRLVEEGRDLPWWHPLVSGTRDTVHAAGVSVRGRVSSSEDDIAVEDLPERIKAWPARWPKQARKPRRPSADRSPAGQDTIDPVPMRSEP